MLTAREHTADKFQARRITPYPLKIVKLPDRLMKNMGNNIPIVQQNPVARLQTFNPQRQETLFFHFNLDIFSQGPDMTVGMAVTDN